MANKDFSFSFVSEETPERIYSKLLSVESWWSGIYSETIEGASRKPGDEFTFKAGGGAHYSKQELVELVPNQRIVWLVKESMLSFLADPGEWTGTRFGFEIVPEGEGTHITFTHRGLVPHIECYGACSSGWNQYLSNLQAALS